MGNPFSNFANEQNPKLIMLGFDYAGKTTILHKLQLGKIEYLVPTIGLNIEKLKSKQFEIITWDVGGADKIRIIWKHYFQDAKGFIYVIDCSDRERMAEVIGELHKLMLDDSLSDLPLLILANKQDLLKQNSEELASELKIETISKNWKIQPCCAITGDGLTEGLQWIQQYTQFQKFNKCKIIQVDNIFRFLFQYYFYYCCSQNEIQFISQYKIEFNNSYLKFSIKNSLKERKRIILIQS